MALRACQKIMAERLRVHLYIFFVVRGPGHESGSGPRFSMVAERYIPSSRIRPRTPDSAICNPGLRNPEYDGRGVHSDFECKSPDSALCNPGLHVHATFERN